MGYRDFDCVYNLLNWCINKENGKRTKGRLKVSLGICGFFGIDNVVGKCDIWFTKLYNVGVYTMINELSDDYLPDTVLHRKKQMEEIRQIFKNFQRLGMGTNLALLGVTGSGKSCIIKKIIEEENNAIYISGSETRTPFKTIKAICNLRIQTHEEVLRITIERLKENPKILVIDEIDKIKNFVQLVNDLNTIYRKTSIPIIIVTLKRNIIEQMPSDARKTLFFERINLPSYTATELKDILNSRIKLIRDLHGFDESVVNYIAAIASNQGSARVVLNITLRCLQKNNFSQRFIEKIYKEMMKEDWLDFVNDINETEKGFLRKLLEKCDYEKEVTSEILQKEMKLSPARTSQLINTFERYSAVVSRHENLGRAGGRRRFIKFATKEIYNELNKVMGYN